LCHGRLAAPRSYVAVTRTCSIWQSAVILAVEYARPVSAKNAFWVCLATPCGRVAEGHLPHAAMSAGCHFPLPRLPTEEELLHAAHQLLFPASTLQALFVSELRKRLSCATTLKGNNGSG